MNIHIALYKWRTEVDDGEVQQCLAAVEALSNKVPGIVEISTAVNTSKYSEGYTHVILVRTQKRRPLSTHTVSTLTTQKLLNGLMQ